MLGKVITMTSYYAVTRPLSKTVRRVINASCIVLYCIYMQHKP